MPRVLHVGPSESPGGMSAVIQLLHNNPPRGWDSEILNTHSNKGFLKKFKLWINARSFLKKSAKNYDIIHFHSASDFSFRRKLNLSKIIKKNSIPAVFHIHSGKFHTWASKQKNIKQKLKPFTIVVLSKSWKKKLDGIIGKTKVINNPINPNIIQNKKIKRKKKQILILGRPDPVKGHDFAFKIAREIRERGWELIATGTTHKEYGITGLGWIDEEKKQSLLRESSVLLIPSKFEGQPMVMLEGMAAGCQIIASECLLDLPDCIHSAPLSNLDVWVNDLKILY